MTEDPGSRLRIALFHALPPGGALRALYEVVRRFPPDIEVDLFTVDLSTVDRRFADLAGGTSRLDLAGAVASSRPYSLPGPIRAVAPRLGRIGAFVVAGEAMRRLERQMAADINSGGYDVVFLHACRFSLSVPIAEWLTVPSVYYAQETRRVGFEAQLSPPGGKRSGLQSLVPFLRRPYEAVGRRRDLRAVASVDRVLCNSRFSSDMLSAAYGVDPVVCYLGVDTDVFAPATGDPTGAGVAEGAPLEVLSVGALHPVKGHDLALQAAGRAATSLGARAAVHVVYERQRPGYAAELESLARSVDVALHLHRGISDDALAQLYRAVCVTVCAARLEPFGLTSLESMSCGTPVVAVQQGGFRETVIDGVNGYLTERQAVPLGDAIVRVARGELAATPGALHDFVADNWSWQAAADRIALQLRLAAAELPTHRRPGSDVGSAPRATSKGVNP